MPKKYVNPSTSEQKMRPAISVEGRDNQMISLAVDLAEKQLREGTASPSVVCHYLKLGAEKEKAKLEIEKLKHETALLEAKTEAVRESKNASEMFAEAMQAFSEYSGKDEDNEYELAN